MMNMFPTLYDTPSNGKKVKQWTVKISEEDGVICINRIHGYESCKMIENKLQIKSGKNIGKKNETTVIQQAEKEALSMWKKQVDKGYNENYPDVKTHENITVLPMLAHDYKKRKKDIKFPCYIQPKIDGVRLIATVTNNKVQFFSRTGKEMFNLEHLCLQIKNVLPDGYYFDGELYTDEIPFEEICGLFRKKNPERKEMEKLNFHIFDIFNPEKKETYKERNILLNNALKIHGPSLKNVETYACDNEIEMEKYHDIFIKDNYEGVILRNINGYYSIKYRSKDLQKYKEFFDEEFKIVDGVSGIGLDHDCVVFHCENENGDLFSVRPKGTRELRKHYLKNIDNIKGKYLTVRYQNKSEQGIVRFGVGICIRDYE